MTKGNERGHWPAQMEAVLPRLLQNLVRLIGLPATMALAERFGGLRIYVPQNPTPEHQYAQVIGYDNLIALAAVYGGEAHFQLPKAHRALLALRDAKIRSEYGPKSLRQLAAEYRLTERHVSRIAASSAVNIHQVSLQFQSENPAKLGLPKLLSPRQSPLWIESRNRCSMSLRKNLT